jgi:hypothetical protein
MQYESNLNEMLTNVNTRSLMYATKQNVVKMLDEFINDMNSCIRQAVERTEADLSSLSCLREVQIGIVSERGKNRKNCIIFLKKVFKMYSKIRNLNLAEYEYE